MKMSLPKFERDSRRWGRVNALVAMDVYELEIFIWILERGKIHKSLHGVITFPPLQSLTFLPFSKGNLHQVRQVRTNNSKYIVIVPKNNKKIPSFLLSALTNPGSNQLNLKCLLFYL